jgi:hypothetical protein
MPRWDERMQRLQCVLFVRSTERAREGSPVDRRGQLLTDPPPKSAWRWGADIRGWGGGWELWEEPGGGGGEQGDWSGGGGIHSRYHTREIMIKKSLQKCYVSYNSIVHCTLLYSIQVYCILYRIMNKKLLNYI